MRLRRMKKIDRSQAGFTLIELLVAVAIIGLLATGISQAIYQIISVNAGGNARMTAVKQVEYAIDIVRRDALMTQKVAPGADQSGFPLEFTWVEWENNQNIVNYSLNPDTHELKRQLSVTTGNTPPVVTEKIIAKNIRSISMDNRNVYLGGKFTITIVSMVEGFRPATESRTFEVLPRPTGIE